MALNPQIAKSKPLPTLPTPSLWTRWGSLSLEVLHMTLTWILQWPKTFFSLIWRIWRGKSLIKCSLIRMVMFQHLEWDPKWSITTTYFIFTEVQDLSSQSKILKWHSVISSNLTWRRNCGQKKLSTELWMMNKVRPLAKVLDCTTKMLPSSWVVAIQTQGNATSIRVDKSCLASLRQHSRERLLQHFKAVKVPPWYNSVTLLSLSEVAI